MSGEKKQKDSTCPNFSINQEAHSDMPSVSRLLNRKPMAIKVSPPTTEPSVSPPSSVAQPPFEITLTTDAPSTLEIESSTPPNASVSSGSEPVDSENSDVKSQPAPIQNLQQPEIQQTSRRITQPSPQLLLWDPSQLKSGTDPLGQGIAFLLEKGAHCALFLGTSPPPPGSPVPHFISRAAIFHSRSLTLAQKEKIKIWTGAKWDPTVVPELWNYFVKTGNAELSPPGNNTNQASNRNIVRAAFGITRTEWLLLVRAGSPQACRGVIAFLSDRTILMELNSALPLLTADPPLTTQTP